MTINPEFDEGSSQHPPRYRDLPAAPGGGRSGWGVFGADDNVGRINLQTPERVASAARLVRTGEVFALNAPIDLPSPPLFGRGAPTHTLLPSPSGGGYDDKLDAFFPQASSQWDALSHVGYAPDVFYNGATNAEIDAGARNTIDHWARRGIAGRAVLLDVESVLGGAGERFDPATSRAITVDELERSRTDAGVDFEPGDVLLLHTGFLGWYARQPEEARRRLADVKRMATVGIERTEAMAAYLWDAGIAALAADNPAVEVWPNDLDGGPFGFLHRMLIGQFGMALGELLWLEDLTRSCRTDGRHEMLFCAAPLHVRGGVGSPANALAIK